MANVARASAARAADTMHKPRFSLDIPATCDDSVFLESLRACGSVLASVLNSASRRVAAGLSPVELSDFVEQELIRAGATPILRGFHTAGSPVFPAAAAVSVNEVAVNGVPMDCPFAKGDVLTIDAACELNGAVCDAAVSVCVSGGGDEGGLLVAAARSVLRAAMEAIRPGFQLSGIAAAASIEAERLGFELADECMAHGTGRALHQPPAVFPDRVEPADARITPGMVLAVEPVLVERGGGRLRTLADGWSRASSGRSAYEERTVVVTEKEWIELTPLASVGW